MKNCCVSVIVPTYRRTNVLQNALNSIAMQSFEDFEIVVVDDNAESSFNQEVNKVINCFKERFPKINLLYIKNQSNEGSAEARNIGIRACGGEYVCFLDDDDLFLPDRIKNQLIPMKEKNADYSITDLGLYDKDERLIEKRTRYYLKENSVNKLLNYHLMYHMTGTDTMMFKKTYLDSIGGFPPINVGDEFYLMHRAIEKKGKFLYVPVCDVKAYVHTGDGGLSSGKSKIDGENVLFEYKKKYFGQLDNKSVRYIKMRHHAVLAFAYIRIRQYVHCFFECIRSLLYSPIGFLEMFYKSRKK